jgi:glucose/arabinose dehydrogenase
MPSIRRKTRSGEAHSAAVGFAFYTATSGRSAFPSEYVGDAFAVFHGSWNRADRTGHKIVRVTMKNGKPTGEYVDFLVGFITADGQPWARPASVTVASDGALLMSDDDGNAIYRISYSK